MSRELIAEQIKKKMGLHAPTVGMITISTAIDKRMRECQIESDERYLREIKSNPKEMKELVEAVLIPETWFFRESKPYKYILNYIQNNPNRKTNILSIPCSTGEEPYSIAMMLMDNNIGVDEFSIDAIDIGENNISKAIKGLYRKNSFRSKKTGFIKKYFSKNNDLYKLSGYVKNKVNFYRKNILDESHDIEAEHYDIILCRNLLIYFDNETQSRLFSTLHEKLKLTGLLILGYAESIQHSEGKFVPAINCDSFVYVKEDNLDKSLPFSYKSKRVMERKPDSINKKERPFSRKQIEEPVSQKNHTRQTEQQSENLDFAFVLANQGKLDEALVICEKYITNHFESARAHYLSGVIYDTKSDIENAYKSLHKAIYLDPKNIEALIHLSLLEEQRGNLDEAQRYKERAQRVQQRLRA